MYSMYSTVENPHFGAHFDLPGGKMVVSGHSVGPFFKICRLENLFRDFFSIFLRFWPFWPYSPPVLYYCTVLCIVHCRIPWTPKSAKFDKPGENFLATFSKNLKCEFRSDLFLSSLWTFSILRKKNLNLWKKLWLYSPVSKSPTCPYIQYTVYTVHTVENPQFGAHFDLLGGKMAVSGHSCRALF